MDTPTHAATVAHQAEKGNPDVVERKTSRTSSLSDNKLKDRDQEGDDDENNATRRVRQLLRPIILFVLAAAILGWWICSTILRDTRHRWIVQTFWAWFFLL